MLRTREGNLIVLAIGLLTTGIVAALLIAMLIFGTKSADTSSSCNSKELQTISLINAERVKATKIDGVVRPNLLATDRTCRVADLRCSELLKKISHFRPVDIATQDTDNHIISMTPDGKLDWFNSAYPQLGITYNRVGEVIAWGYSTPSGVVGAWMRSLTHKQVLLSKRYTELGVGWCGTTWPRTAGEFLKP